MSTSQQTLGHLVIKSTCKPGQGYEDYMRIDSQPRYIDGLTKYLKENERVDFLTLALEIPERQFIGNLQTAAQLKNWSIFTKSNLNMFDSMATVNLDEEVKQH